jgi:hypothetical protein
MNFMAEWQTESSQPWFQFRLSPISARIAARLAISQQPTEAATAPTSPDPTEASSTARSSDPPALSFSARRAAIVANFLSTISLTLKTIQSRIMSGVAGSGDVFSEQPNVLAEVEQGGGLVMKFYPHAALSE